MLVHGRLPSLSIRLKITTFLASHTPPVTITVPRFVRARPVLHFPIKSPHHIVHRLRYVNC
jgi:hypothetical protein